MDSEKLEKYCLLEKENGELILALSTSKAACEELHRKFEAEEEENKNLKMTLALRAEYDREQIADTKDWQIDQLEEQNRVLNNTNQSLLSSLAESRSQLSMYFHESARKGRLITELQQKIDMLEAAKREETKLFKYTEGDVMYISEMHKEELEQLQREIECVKAQKEDISNHSKNSENTFMKSILDLQQQLRNIQQANAAIDSLPESKDKSVQISELTKKLKNALEAIDELEDENSMLREKLDDCIDNKNKLEEELDTQKQFLTEETLSYTADCENYEKQLANLNEEMTKLEELHDKCQSDLKEANEKQVKMRISFANDKASFCHDMERTEEKWHAEVVKLKNANEKLEKLVFDSAKETMNKMEMHVGQQKKLEELHQEIKELEEKLEDSKHSHKKELDSWNEECIRLDDEVCELIAKRKTEMKRMQTLQKKYKWLKASTITLAAQRRCEIDALKKEKQTVQDRCELLRREKNEWLSELKKDVNAWKDEVSVREDLQSRVNELEKENKVLEERVEVITEKWREECLEYQANVTKLQELLKDKKMQEDMLRSHIKTTDNYVEQLEQKCRDHEDEFKLTAIGFEELLKAEQREVTREKTYRKVISRQCMDLKEAYDRDRNKLNAARNRCGAYERDIEQLQGQQQADQTTIAELRTQVEKLRVDMGVEELDELEEHDEWGVNKPEAELEEEPAAELDELEEVDEWGVDVRVVLSDDEPVAELDDELKEEPAAELNESTCSSCSSCSSSDVNAYSTHTEDEEEERLERQKKRKMKRMMKSLKKAERKQKAEELKAAEQLKKEPEDWEMV